MAVPWPAASQPPGVAGLGEQWGNRAVVAGRSHSESVTAAWPGEKEGSPGEAEGPHSGPGRAQTPAQLPSRAAPPSFLLLHPNPRPQGCHCGCHGDEMGMPALESPKESLPGITHTDTDTDNCHLSCGQVQPVQPHTHLPGLGTLRHGARIAHKLSQLWKYFLEVSRCPHSPCPVEQQLQVARPQRPDAPIPACSQLP